MDKKNIKTEWAELSVTDGERMRTYTARPSGMSNLPGLIVIQEAFGVNSHIRDVTERFAREGYAAIAPELYHRTAPGFEGSYTDYAAIAPHREVLTDERLEADLRSAYMWLLSQEFVDKEALASVGFCMGGRASFLANASLQLKAAVSYYGGRIAPDLLPRAKNLHAPILMFWGGQDSHIPLSDRRQILDALDTHKKSYVNVDFSEAGHGYFCDERGSFNAAAAKQSWLLTLEFLKEQLS